jgi:hypothetical protein
LFEAIEGRIIISFTSDRLTIDNYRAASFFDVLKSQHQKLPTKQDPKNTFEHQRRKHPPTDGLTSNLSISLSFPLHSFSLSSQKGYGDPGKVGGHINRLKLEKNAKM